LGIRIINHILQQFEGKRAVQSVIIPVLMPALLEAFTNEVFGQKSRARILHQFFFPNYLRTSALNLGNTVIYMILVE
jgi:hypothetical protein